MAVEVKKAATKPQGGKAAAYSAKMTLAKEAAAEAEAMKAEAVDELIAAGNEIIAKLAEFGLVFTFGRAKRHRGPNKGKPAPVDQQSEAA